VFSSENQGTGRRRKFLSNEDRKAISHLMSLYYNRDGKLKRGTYKFIASLYSVSISTIKRIWKRTKETGEVCHKKTKNCGRKRVQIDHNQFRQIPLSKRSTLRDLASALNISKSSLQRAQKRGTIRRHSNAIKPFFE
jgi:transposase